jgi:hypothetical protein
MRGRGPPDCAAHACALITAYGRQIRESSIKSSFIYCRSKRQCSLYWTMAPVADSRRLHGRGQIVQGPRDGGRPRAGRNGSDGSAPKICL